MLNVNTLKAFVEEQDTHSYLTGNCGRTVRRFLERHFSNNVARFTVKSECAHLLQFAHDRGELDWGVKMAERVLQHTEEEGNLSFCVVNVDAVAKTMQVVVAAQEIPLNVKGRLSFLKHVAFGLRRFIALAELRGLSLDVAEAASSVGSVAGYPAPIDSALVLSHFDKLMASDFSELDATPDYVVELAMWLNPAILQEMARVTAEYDKVIDAAMAQLDAVPTQPRPRLSALFNELAAM